MKVTDRYNALIVVLENDLREDDAQGLIAAIQQLKGVTSVTGNEASADTIVACERARHELGRKLIELVYPRKP